MIESVLCLRNLSGQMAEFPSDSRSNARRPQSIESLCGSRFKLLGDARKIMSASRKRAKLVLNPVHPVREHGTAKNPKNRFL
jgi:hypothetical protein